MNTNHALVYLIPMVLILLSWLVYLKWSTRKYRISKKDSKQQKIKSNKSEYGEMGIGIGSIVGLIILALNNNSQLLLLSMVVGGILGTILDTVSSRFLIK